MNKKLAFLAFFSWIAFPLILHCQVTREIYHSVVEVYTDPSIEDYDTISVVGYYTDPDYDLLLEFYGDFFKNEAFAPHSILTLTGVQPPADAWNGGYVLVNGVVTFVDVPDPYHPEDSLMAFLNAFLITIYIPGQTLPMAPGGDRKEHKIKVPGGNRSMNNRDCDPCKFAFLLSGGIDKDNNHEKYWKTLEALYQYKVNSGGYCADNVFVHYYDGTPRGAGIPAGRVIRADNAKIDSSFQVIADRVAACKASGTPATFQKMVSNHGEKSTGNINLLGSEVLTPVHLRDLQQKVIDSCCSKILEELLQCYAGYVVDSMLKIDNKNKTTIRIYSSVDRIPSYSPHGVVDPALAAMIASLNAGNNIGKAYVDAKLAYDEYIENSILPMYHHLLDSLRYKPGIPDRQKQIGRATADSIEAASGICKSRNVTILPFTHYCEWDEFVVPPGGQLVVDFSSDGTSCTNVTVYKVDPVTGEKVKVAVWNWNNPASYGYQEGYEQRVINGDLTDTTTFMIHNDNGISRLAVEILGSQVHPESPSNSIAWPGPSFGGDDTSFYEFRPDLGPDYFIEWIDQLNISLYTLPAILGPGHVENFGFSFMIDTSNVFWSDMELYIKVLDVFNPDTLMIMSMGGSIPETKVTMEESGVYIVPLGDFTSYEYAMITMIPMNGMNITLDCWGLRTGMEAPPPLMTAWIGGFSSDWTNPANWSDGVPGVYHSVTIMPGTFQPIIITDVIVKSITVSTGASISTAPGAILTVTGD